MESPRFCQSWRAEEAKAWVHPLGRGVGRTGQPSTGCANKGRGRVLWSSSRRSRGGWYPGHVCGPHRRSRPVACPKTVAVVVQTVLHRALTHYSHRSQQHPVARALSVRI